jgi:hypothetical protein
MSLPRKPAVPPAGRPRKHLSVGTKLAAALLRLGFKNPENVEWHHEPPLSLRPWVGDDYDPPESDPRHLVPIEKYLHVERTAKTDTPAAAKTRRQAKRQLEHVQKMLGEAERVSRWPKRKLRSRSSFQ